MQECILFSYIYRPARCKTEIGRVNTIHQTSPIPKEWAHRKHPSLPWKLCRGKSSVEGHWSVQPELLSNPPWLYNLCRVAADQNWFGAVILNLGLPVYTEFPCLKFFPLHNYQKWDCLLILAHTFFLLLFLIVNSAHLNIVHLNTIQYKWKFHSWILYSWTLYSWIVHSWTLYIWKQHSAQLNCAQLNTVQLNSVQLNTVHVKTSQCTAE